MVDPRLNSVHLEAPRREEFRRAREALLDARGSHTLAGEDLDARGWRSADPFTLVENHASRVPAGLNCWLLDREYVYPLRTGLNTIGRAPDNDVVVQDSYVSRRHCAIVVHITEGFELHDVASKNGTYLNGRRLEGPTKLNPGDEIRMCDRQLIFMSRGAAEHLPGHQPTLTE